MSKKKRFLNPTQMVILSGFIGDDGQSNGGLDWAKPDPFLDEEEEIVLPDGTVGIEEGDVIIPDITGESGFDADEAYY